MLSTHFFVVWNTLERTLATLRARGYLSDVMYFPDESYYPAREEAAEQLIGRSWYDGPNLASLARDAVDSWRRHTQLAFQLQKYQLDEAQVAALLQLLFARYGGLLCRSLLLIEIRDISIREPFKNALRESDSNRCGYPVVR